MKEDSPELIPVRMLNEFVYCPRLFWLEWVQQEFADSEDTVAGRHDHRRVDREGGDLPPPEEIDEELRSARSVLLSAPSEGLIARIDLVEMEGGEVCPVDYKHGREPRTPERVWDTDLVQLCGQALILRENGFQVEHGYIYYVSSRHKIRVPIDEQAVAFTRGALQRLRATLERGQIPAPLVDSPKCPRCSLVGICLPDEVNHLAARAALAPEDVRRLYPARDDALPVYVQAQGAKVGKRGEVLEIADPSGEVVKARLLDTSQLCLFGNVQVTAQALNELMAQGIPVAHFTYGGWFHGITSSLGSRNVELRLNQYQTVQNQARSLDLARGFVQRKILNCRTLLRRNHKGDPDKALAELARMAEFAVAAPSQESLLGIEGTAARIYFREFAGMLRAVPEDEEGVAAFSFEERNRRPPKDPVNALLSLAYTVLAKDWTVTLLAVGFDPYLGFFHRPRFGRPALALDLMEEFRPLIADSVVINMINNGEVKPGDFLHRSLGVALTPEGRKKFFASYERRTSTLVTVPRFGYKASYRRLLEVQARLLGRYLSGEIPEYPGFTTR